MSELFLKLVNMSITAGWIVLVVAILRICLRRVPKSVFVLLWALVGFRLICPVTMESVLSLIPSKETIPSDFLYTTTPQIHTGINAFNSTVNPYITQSLAPEVGNSVNPAQIITYICSLVWCVGVVLMLLYMALSYIRVWNKVKEAAPSEGNVWICDGIGSAFILGIFRPRIYLPSCLNDEDTSYVLAHERAHLRRKDHWWKPLGFLLLSVYWFHPLLWLAYILLCRDIEFACDERVLQELGADNKKQYSNALINCSATVRAISACPLAFGEVGIKKRIVSILNYKKPAFWGVLICIVLVAVLAACCLTDPILDDSQHTSSVQSGVVHDTQEPQVAVNMAALQLKYPQYFGLDATNGLVVYIWQMAENSYSCALFPKRNAPYTWQELAELRGTSLEDMRAIVGSYEIEREKVSVSPIINPLSSYAYTINAEYTEQLERLFWGGYGETYLFWPTTIDQASFDIDQDGIIEDCTLHYGPTYGLFTFYFMVYENGQLEHGDLFQAPHMQLSFAQNSQGIWQLRGEPNIGSQVYFMDISVDQGHIALSCPNVEVSNWSSDDWKHSEWYRWDVDHTGATGFSVYDTKGNFLLRMESARRPKIEFISDGIYRLTVQAGTGASTNWSVCCDIERGRISQVYHYALATWEQYILLGYYENGQHGITVCDIFDPDNYSETYMLENCSPSADPIVDWNFAEGGCFKVTYVSGKDYEYKIMSIQVP